MRVISWLAEWLSASQVRFCSLDLVGGVCERVKKKNKQKWAKQKEREQRKRENRKMDVEKERRKCITNAIVACVCIGTYVVGRKLLHQNARSFCLSVLSGPASQNLSQCCSHVWVSKGCLSHHSWQPQCCLIWLCKQWIVDVWCNVQLVEFFCA
jgi:hypothetical protein